jgi:hypothetical protein
MSRLTGTDAFNMMEAYNAVYAPEEEVELTEEQVQEDFENWVNSLVEEGYDLSEYTWEDMYEAYLSEIPINPAGNARPISNAPYQSRFARPMNAGTPQRTGRATAVSRPPVSNLGSGYRGQELQQTARARASQVGTTRQGTAGGPTVGGNTPIGSTTRPTPQASAQTRPAVQATRPVVQTKPTVQGVTKPTPTAPTAPTAPTTQTAPARPSLRSDIADLQKMRLASQERQRKGGATVVGSQMASFDPFDIVKGHLLDEGYADTEEAALQIMANMSEEWRQSIVEGVVDSKTMTSDERRRKRNDEYRSENPTLPSGNPMGPNAQLMRQMAHAKRRGKKEKKD